MAESDTEKLEDSMSSFESEAPSIVPTRSIELPTINLEATSSNLELDDSVKDIIRMMSQEVNKQLADFVAEETKKIQQEISELDQRHEIEGAVNRRLNSEKDKELDRLSKRLDAEKEELLAQEKRRHELAMNQILEDCYQKLEEKKTEIEENYALLITDTISKEYAKQSEKLANILKGKEDELYFRQKQMNQGIKSSLGLALDQFNSSHNRLIEEVKEQKDNPNVVKMSDFMNRTA